jgi:hypothetical protein
VIWVAGGAEVGDGVVRVLSVPDHEGVEREPERRATRAYPSSTPAPYRRSWTYGRNGTPFWDRPVGRSVPSVYRPACRRPRGRPRSKGARTPTPRCPTRRQRGARSFGDGLLVLLTSSRHFGVETDSRFDHRVLADEMSCKHFCAFSVVLAQQSSAAASCYRGRSEVVSSPRTHALLRFGRVIAPCDEPSAASVSGTSRR